MHRNHFINQSVTYTPMPITMNRTPLTCQAASDLSTPCIMLEIQLRTGFVFTCFLPSRNPARRSKQITEKSCIKRYKRLTRPIMSPGGIRPANARMNLGRKYSNAAAIIIPTNTGQLSKTDGNSYGSTNGTSTTTAISVSHG